MKTGKKRIEKLYYSIGEVASMFEVNISMIRFYEKEFDIIKPHRNKKGNRLFTQKDVNHLKRIFYLVKEEGHALSQVKEMIKGAPEEPTHIETLENLPRTSDPQELATNKNANHVKEKEKSLTVRQEVIHRLKRIRSVLEELDSKL